MQCPVAHPFVRDSIWSRDLLHWIMAPIRFLIPVNYGITCDFIDRVLAATYVDDAWIKSNFAYLTQFDQANIDIASGIIYISIMYLLLGLGQSNSLHLHLVLPIRPWIRSFIIICPAPALHLCLLLFMHNSVCCNLLTGDFWWIILHFSKYLLYTTT